MTLRVSMIARAAALLISAAIVVPEAANAAAAGFSSLGSNGGWYSSGASKTGWGFFSYSKKSGKTLKLKHAKSYMSDSIGVTKAGTYSGNALAGQPKD